MIKYIYLIVCECGCAGYVGQTQEAEKRNWSHNYNLINENNQVKYNYKVYKHLRECSVAEIELMIVDTVEQEEDESNDDFDKRVAIKEMQWMDELTTNTEDDSKIVLLNSDTGKHSKNPQLYNKEYKQINKDAIKKQRQVYNAKNKDVINKKRVVYYTANKDAINKKRREANAKKKLANQKKQ